MEMQYMMKSRLRENKKLKPRNSREMRRSLPLPLRQSQKKHLSRKVSLNTGELLLYVNLKTTESSQVATVWALLL